MNAILKVFGLLFLTLLVLGAWFFMSFLREGVSARRDPTAAEAFVAHRLRHLAIPAEARGTRNPVPLTDEVLADALAHFADHCAICHANDGSGDTEIGRNSYPPAPDMRKEATQSLSDGELFYIIRNGVRFTGMPAWGEGDPKNDEESWELVHFVRHLPDLTEEELREMEKLNPKPVHDHENSHGDAGRPEDQDDHPHGGNEPEEHHH